MDLEGSVSKVGALSLSQLSSLGYVNDKWLVEVMVSQDKREEQEQKTSFQ